MLQITLRPKKDMNPLMLTAAKSSLTNLIPGKSIFREIFEGMIFYRTIPTTLLQIFCKIILNSKVIVKSIVVPDGNWKWNSEVLMG